MYTRVRRWLSTSFAVAVTLVGSVTPAPAPAASPCPAEMALVALHDEASGARESASVCVDKWEASLVERQSGRAVSPYVTPDGSKVRAVSKSNVVPQAYISKVDAEQACRASKKRLCKEAEWVKACQGKTPSKFPYGDEHKAGYCNDAGKAPLATYYPDTQAAYSSASAMNDARLNQLPGTVAKTGRFRRCKNRYGIYDMVGNLHEWVDDPRGTFRGGYYLDTHQNGDGCKYRTDAHDVTYHDYSTGFRCCKDPR
jgi:hypothetical protein